MRFSLTYPTVMLDPPAELLTAEGLASIAAAAEEAGFAGIGFPEHPATPQSWRDGAGHDSVDPFLALTVAATATAGLRLLTFLAVLPYRNPFLLAKTTATLDRLSGGRLTLGVGTGYLEGEFAALGVDFGERNALFDEALEVLRLAWTGEPVDWQGRSFTADGAVSRPTPVATPRPPVWIGGNSRLTRRRVAALAEGWAPVPTSPAQVLRRRTAPLESLDRLAGWIRELQEEREQLGRLAPADVLYMVTDADPIADPERYLDSVQRLADIGVTWLSLGVRGRSVAEVTDRLAEVGERVLARVGAPAPPPCADADVRAVVALHRTYADALDRREFDRLDRVFTADVVAGYPGHERIVGLPALVAFMRDSHADVARTVHRVVDVAVTVDGDMATGTAAKRNDLLRAGDDGQTVVTGRYTDELVRTPEGWRIRSRRSTHA
ncbi:TIGR03619 family F420-dependent LLM class oxidoreductase [Trujillonella endophytica]|uniref:Probable F420-dependent oxidoreductase, Rv2161c family n=1 Tax=Trujillonella endophytica TaxID=673521 RepID=A0A1H8VXQ4_9ACTN|nr:TIGR03619 family F420-dependent LLM class oxidoreductase [Trujillella endophytica]SEP20084.1 probable F420-dependent oxidoreductase, Rv2161c family [Trujillella endophytica]